MLAAHFVAIVKLIKIPAPSAGSTPAKNLTIARAGGGGVEGVAPPLFSTLIKTYRHDLPCVRIYIGIIVCTTVKTKLPLFSHLEGREP